MVFPCSADPQLPPVILAPRKQPRNSTAAAAATKAAAGSSVCLAALRSYNCHVRDATRKRVCVMAG
jgi:hypothetical protein